MNTKTYLSHSEKCIGQWHNWITNNAISLLNHTMYSQLGRSEYQVNDIETNIKVATRRLHWPTQIFYIF